MLAVGNTAKCEKQVGLLAATAVLHWQSAVLGVDHNRRCWHPVDHTELTVEANYAACHFSATAIISKFSTYILHPNFQLAALPVFPLHPYRIEQFEEQLNAAISRFAPGQAGSRCGTPTAAAAAAEPCTTWSASQPLAAAGRQEVQQQLSTLQQDVAQLQTRLTVLLDSQKHALQQQQHDAVKQQQLQELEVKLTEGYAELAEQVLQLELQLQTVSCRRVIVGRS